MVGRETPLGKGREPQVMSRMTFVLCWILLPVANTTDGKVEGTGLKVVGLEVFEEEVSVQFVWGCKPRGKESRWCGAVYRAAWVSPECQAAPRTVPGRTHGSVWSERLDPFPEWMRVEGL